MSGPKQRMVLTPAQAVYLKDLVTFDLEDTELTKNEQQQAKAILRKVDEVIEVFRDRQKLPEQLNQKWLESHGYADAG